MKSDLEVRIVCTDDGQHSSAVLASLNVDVIDPADFARRVSLRGEPLAAYLRGEGPHAGWFNTITLDSYSARTTATKVVETTVKRATASIIQRKDGRQSYRFKCPRCNRDVRLTGETLKEIAASPLAVFDLSKMPS